MSKAFSPRLGLLDHTAAVLSLKARQGPNGRESIEHAWSGKFLMFRTTVAQKFERLVCEGMNDNVSATGQIQLREIHASDERAELCAA
jgi:hypothetical protein